jgi:hypothetical protein
LKLHHNDPLARVEKVQAKRNAYPPVGDQLDAIFKMAVALQKQGVELPTETKDWLTSCQAVKDAHKKESDSA